MKIKSLELINWYQHTNHLLDLTKMVTTISGANELGKTNLYSAFTYLSDGKDIYNSQITTSAIQQGKESASVKLTFENDDTFEKIIAHNSSDNAYLFNDANMTKKDFENKLKETGFLNARIFINPLYFTKQEHWAKRSELLINQFADIKHEDVLKEAPELKELIDIYKKNKLDHATYLQKVRKEHKELKKKLDEIHIRLKEASLPPDAENMDRAKIEDELFYLEEKLKDQRSFYYEVKNTAIKDAKCAVCGGKLGGEKQAEAKEKAQKKIGEMLDFVNKQGMALKERRDALVILLDGNLDHESEGKKTGRIKELEKEMKEVSDQLEKKEYYLNMIEQYEEKQKELAEKQINKAFKDTGVYFSFFEAQKNSIIKQACTPRNSSGISEKFWSNGESLRLGIKICEKLQEAFNLDLPVLIDNSESISEDIKTDKQLVFFEMDKSKKELTITN